MNTYDVVVIGGGPAGLAAAISAHKEGSTVCLIERESKLGGILKQCIHDGFGLVRFNEKLSGPEYAFRFIKEFEDLGIEARLSSFVTKIDRDDTGFDLSLVSNRGIDHIRAVSLVLATGCRERTARQVNIHGTRPAGILTAGSAQNYINLLGEKIAKKVVILGSGDIGLIMARRLTLEGCEVLGVYEVMSMPSGLARNVHQCLEDFDIPLHLSTTVTQVFGKDRVEAVEVAKVDENMKPIPGTEERIECDTLIVSVGLIPENELAESIGVEIDPKTKGPSCDKNYMTSVPGVFSCGNSFHVFDLVDYVTVSGEAAGISAAHFAQGTLESADHFDVVIPAKTKITPGKLVCIGCPKGCEMDVSMDGDKVVVVGNSCPKGEDFAIAEMTNPVRVLCSSVKTTFAEYPVLPVRTTEEIPKAKLMEAMEVINAFELDHEVEVGECLIKNILGTSADIIATGHIRKEKKSMNPLVLTFDIGTQSIRAILAKKDGSFVDKVQHNYSEPYFTEHPFWAEQKPNFYYDELCKASRDIIARNPELASDIICVTITTIRDTVLCLDKNNKPLGNFIVWLDKREAKFKASDLPFIPRMLFKLVGKYNTIEYQYRDSKCNWIKQNDPIRWEQTDSYVYLSGYLNYLMTGNLVDSCGSVIGHMPYDYKNRKWMGRNDLTYSVFAIPEEKLFPVVQPGEIVGEITAQCSKETLIPAGTPIVATGSDKGCETVGLNVQSLGSAAVSFGTSATIQIASDRYIEPQPFMPAYPAAIPGRFNPEIQIYRGYWMLTWFINEFCTEEKRIAKERNISVESLLNTKLADVPAGSDGLLIQPYWTPGVATPSARGSMVGFTDRQSKYHIYRAIIEGINFELMCGMKQLEKQSHTPIKEIYVGGGGAKSPEILQLTADMFGMPVKRIQTHEASGLGSSLIGFVSMGEFDSYEEAAASMIHTGTIYYPNQQQHKIYRELFEVYKKLYGRLRSTYNTEQEVYRRISHE